MLVVRHQAPALARRQRLLAGTLRLAAPPSAARRARCHQAQEAHGGGDGADPALGQSVLERQMEQALEPGPALLDRAGEGGVAMLPQIPEARLGAEALQLLGPQAGHPRRHRQRLAPAQELGRDQLLPRSWPVLRLRPAGRRRLGREGRDGVGGNHGRTCIRL